MEKTKITKDWYECLQALENSLMFGENDIFSFSDLKVETEERKNIFGKIKTKYYLTDITVYFFDDRLKIMYELKDSYILNIVKNFLPTKFYNARKRWEKLKTQLEGFNVKVTLNKKKTS